MSPIEGPCLEEGVKVTGERFALFGVPSKSGEIRGAGAWVRALPFAGVGRKAA